MIRKVRALVLVAVCVVMASCASRYFGGDGRGRLNLDPGGVSVDLSGCGTNRLETIGDNLLANGGFEAADGWKDNTHVFTDDDKERARVLPVAQANSERRLVSGDSPEGARHAEIVCAKEAAVTRSGAKPDFCNAFTTAFTVPEGADKFLLRFKYAAECLDVPGSNFKVVTLFTDGAAPGKKQTGCVFNEFSPSPVWKEVNHDFIVPAGTKNVELYFRLHGCGRLRLDDVSVKRVASAADSPLLLFPMAWADNTFCLSSGQPAIMAFKNERYKEAKAPLANVTLPEGFKLLDVNSAVKLLDKSQGPNGITYRLDIKTAAAAAGVFGLLVDTSLAPSGKTYEGSCGYEDGSYKSAGRAFSLKVIPAISGKRPKSFEMGAYFGHRLEQYTDTRAIKELADFYAGCGFNTIHFVPLNRNAVLCGMLRDAKIKHYVQPTYFGADHPSIDLINGYSIGGGAMTDSVKFKRFDGSTFLDRFAICPVEVYKEGAYYRDFVAPELRRLIATEGLADSIMANWEPFMYDFQGCFCERCRDEFLAYSGMSKDSLKWPDDAVRKPELKDKWIKFRSWQHAKLVVTLEGVVSKLGKEAGKESHFIPEISSVVLTDSGNSRFGSQYNPLDYLDKLPVIEAWGPYLYHEASKPYAYTPGAHLLTFVAAKEEKEFVAAHVPDPRKRPKLIAFPHGIEADWLTEPEAISFEVLCYFLNGWEGAIPFLFPAGYDNRYWAALASANSCVADFEDFVFQGKKGNRATVEPSTPLPVLNLKDALWKDYYGKGQFSLRLLRDDLPLLQTVEYELEGKRLVAVGNFWEKGDAFFTLKLGGLPEGRYTIREPLFNRQHGKAGGFSAEELREGVLLHVGSLRWAFFVVEPNQEGNVIDELMSQGEIRDAMESRLPAIEKAMEFEKAIRSQAEAKEVKPPDYSGIKADKVGGMALTVERPAGKDSPLAVFSGADSRITVDPLRGAKVAGWQVAGKALVTDKELGLGVDAFWWPSTVNFSNSPYEFIGQGKDGGKLRVSFGKSVTAEDCPQLAGLRLSKTITVGDGGLELEVSTELANMSQAPVEFSFRHNNMPSYPKDGQIVMAGREKELVFKRNLMPSLLYLQPERDKALDGPHFEDRHCFPIGGASLALSAPGWPFKMQAEAVNGGDLYGFVFWDGFTMDSPTIEPLFKKIKLQPGQSWKARTAFRLIPSRRNEP